jgi:hypothetical protein
MLLCLFVACAANTQNEGNTEDFDQSQQRSAKDDPRVEVAPLSTSANLTWQLDSIEQCVDSFGLGGCTAQRPSNQCPAVRAGQPCSVELAVCTVIMGSYYQRFFCYPK